MAWKRIHAYRPIAPRWSVDSGEASYTQLTSTQTKIGVVFMVPRSGTINRVVFRISSVTTSQDLSVGLYTVDSNGNPTTTNYGGSQPATLTQPTPGIKSLTLPTGAQASAGDMVAFVVEWASTPGDLYLRYNAYESTLPYPCRYVSGSWLKDMQNYVIQAVIGYSDGSYAIAGSPVLYHGSTSFNINSSPDERGNLFRFPFGIRFQQIHTIAPNGGAFDVVVYLGSDSYSVSVPAYVPGNVLRGKLLTLSSPIEVPANTSFRIAVKPTTGTSVSNFWYLQFSLTTQKDEYIGSVSDGLIKMTTRTDGGTWTDHDTQIHIISPVVTEIETTAVGAGGFPFPPHVIIT